MTPAILNWSELSPEARRGALSRPPQARADLRDAVAAIIDHVRREGDAALLGLTEKFDGCRPKTVAVDREEIAAAPDTCAARVMRAMRDAEQRIRAFHAASLPHDTQIETAPGMRCELRHHAIDPVGLYVPGGSAVLVSTVLMLGVPASLAGCKRVVLCTPPGPDGSVAGEVLAAAALCGIERVCGVGGAQAIAAMAYGSESVPRCNKLFGPGNAWVTEAKMQVSTDPEGAAIDLPAGPSEVLVIADDGADPVAVGWDLLAQAEHGPDSQAVLLTDSVRLARSVSEKLAELTASLPRAQVLRASLNAARLIITGSIDEAVRIAEQYAPEHLIVNCRRAREVADRVRNAGSIFVGPWTPESLGDYCSGTNHVLPTYGWARSYGSLSVADFMRRYTVQEATIGALAALGPTAEALAEFEGLEAHRMSIRHRLRGVSAA